MRTRHNVQPFLRTLMVLLGASVGLAQAQAPNPAPAPFPVVLAETAYVAPAPGLVLWGQDNGGLRLTWHSTVPGLSFCVAYATARGLYADENNHCLVTDRNGNAVDTVRLGYARDVADLSNVVLVGNVVLVDNRVDATVVPIAAWTKVAPKPSR